jgi:hypothetical protein
LWLGLGFLAFSAIGAREISAWSARWASREEGFELPLAVLVSGEELVADLQLRVATDPQQRRARTMGFTRTSSGAPATFAMSATVCPAAGGGLEPDDAFGRVGEPHTERPRFKLGGAHRDAAPVGEGGTRLPWMTTENATTMMIRYSRGASRRSAPTTEQTAASGRPRARTE